MSIFGAHAFLLRQSLVFVAASRRTIRVVHIDGNKGSLKAYCYRRKAYRVFVLENMLAIAPVSGHFAG
ncbi:hypothetical protein AC624_00435 [Bacillus sp. FJAT-27238]|nr:hypothetical protein AC624_00435 [Bacillus sp. FJAT-27238]